MYKIESKVLNEEERKKIEDGLFIDLPCGFTHYKTEGETGEWAVLVHGYATPYFIYDKVAERLLKEGFRVLRYDLIGRGFSERVNEKYTPELFVRQLKELTERVIGEESFYLFGTSMGGIITTSFTAKYPEKVKKLVLLAPAGMVYKPPFYMKLAKTKGIGTMFFKAFGGKALVKKCASEMIYSGAEVKKDYEEKFARSFQYKGVLDATLSSMRDTILAFDVARKGYEGTAKSNVPVLTIWGTADKTMPYYQAETMQKVLPNMRLVTYENSGHIFLYDEGERTMNDVMPFLQGK